MNSQMSGIELECDFHCGLNVNVVNLILSFILDYSTRTHTSWSEKPEFLRAANQGKIGKKDLIWGAPYKNISKFHEHFENTFQRS